MAVTAKSTYLGNLRTEATHLKSGTTIITDAPTDNHGKGESFSPTDLVATALGSCMLTIMGIKAANHDIKMEGTQVEVTKTMASNPRRISKIEIKVYMAKYEYSDRDKKVLEKAAKGCPVGSSLSTDLEEVIEIIWP